MLTLDVNNLYTESKQLIHVKMKVKIHYSIIFFIMHPQKFCVGTNCETVKQMLNFH